MMATFKDVFGAVGENAAGFARDFGEYAKDFGEYAKDFGGKAAEFGKEVGSRTSALAHRVGPKRGAIALGIIAAAIAVPFIVRYVKTRRAADALVEDDGEAAVPQPRARAGAVPAPADVAAIR